MYANRVTVLIERSTVDHTPAALEGIAGIVTSGDPTIEITMLDNPNGTRHQVTINDDGSEALSNLRSLADPESDQSFKRYAAQSNLASNPEQARRIFEGLCMKYAPDQKPNVTPLETTSVISGDASDIPA